MENKNNNKIISKIKKWLNNEQVRVISRYFSRELKGENHKRKEEIEFLINNVSFLDINIYKPAEFIFCFRNNIKQRPVCEYCGNQNIKFGDYRDGYYRFCSRTCATKSPVTQNKMKSTCIKNHGVENISQAEKTKKKKEKKALEKYGVKNVSQAKEIKEKKMKKALEVYGVENVSQSKIIKEKKKQKALEKYGVENVFQAEEVKDKIKAEVINKRKNIYYDVFIKEIEKKFIHNITKEEFALKGSQGDYVLECKNCHEKIVNKRTHNYGYHINIISCPYCVRRVSQAEKNITNFVKEIYNKKVLTSNRSVLKNAFELDIYLPDTGIAIEYNGLIWHSVGNHKLGKFNNLHQKDKFKTKHKNKTDQCINKNIQLFHIFENEWLDENKQKIWKNILKERININNLNNISKNNTKTTINFISKQLSDDFLNMYHLEGKIENRGNFVNIGMFDGKEDNLLFVLVIEILENNKFKIIRYGINYNIDNKIFNSDELLKQSFNYFLENYIKEKNIKDYNIQAIVNLRYSYGKELEQLGFNIIKQTDPHYFYFLPNENILYDRNHDKIKNKSENELFNLGFRKIYDSGNFILEYNN